MNIWVRGDVGYGRMLAGVASAAGACDITCIAGEEPETASSLRCVGKVDIVLCGDDEEATGSFDLYIQGDTIGGRRPRKRVALESSSSLISARIDNG